MGLAARFIWLRAARPRCCLMACGGAGKGLRGCAARARGKLAAACVELQAAVVARQPGGGVWCELCIAVPR